MLFAIPKVTQNLQHVLLALGHTKYGQNGNFSASLMRFQNATNKDALLRNVQVLQYNEYHIHVGLDFDNSLNGTPLPEASIPSKAITKLRLSKRMVSAIFAEFIELFCTQLYQAVLEQVLINSRESWPAAISL